MKEKREALVAKAYEDYLEKKHPRPPKNAVLWKKRAPVTPLPAPSLEIWEEFISSLFNEYGNRIVVNGEAIEEKEGWTYDQFSDELDAAVTYVFAAETNEPVVGPTDFEKKVLAHYQRNTDYYTSLGDFEYSMDRGLNFLYIALV